MHSLLPGLKGRYKKDYTLMRFFLQVLNAALAYALQNVNISGVFVV